MKKLLALLLALVMVLGVLAGCNKAPVDTNPTNDTTPAANNTKPTDDTTPTEKPLFQIWSEAKDVTEVPDWEGETLTLTCWWKAYSAANGGLTKEESTEKIVLKEIKRITGCEFSYENSFMNEGQSMSDMVAKLVATDSLPDVIEHGAMDILNDMGKNDFLWDVSELMPKYAPTYWRMNGPDNPLYAPLYQKQIDELGGIFYYANYTDQKIPYLLGKHFPDLYPEYVDFFTEEEIREKGFETGPMPDRRYFYIRQDILDQLFPGCNSSEDWKRIVKERPLEPEDYLDIPLDSPADFEKMMYDIKAILDKQGDPSVYAFYTHNGTGNWSLLAQHRQFFGTLADYIGYYDIEKGTIVKSLEQDWYKDIVAMINKWFRDGICNPEAPLLSHDQHKERVANDKYVVLQADFGPHACGHPNPDSYRRVYMRWNCSDVTKDGVTVVQTIYPKELPWTNALCKGGNLDTEEKVAQYLMSLEFLTTRAAKLLCNYGHPDMGFYVDNGDGTISLAGELKGLVAAGSPYEAMNKFYRKHGFGAWGSVNSGWPGYVNVAATQTNAHWTDDKREIAPVTFNVIDAVLPSVTTFPAPVLVAEGLNVGLDSLLSSMFTEDVEGFAKFWGANSRFEEMVTKTIIAPTEADFETAYQALLDTIVELGWDDATTQEMNKMLLETHGVAAALKANGLPVPEGY